MLSTTLRLPWARRAERRKLEAVDQVIAAFGLERFRHHRTAELSTGTRRVVDLASIVLAEPRLLLLDEPTAGIAQREAEAFIPLLRRIHEVADTTIVLVEHDVPLVFELCSTVVVMELGRVVVAGPPEVIRADSEGAGRLPWCQRRGPDGVGSGRGGRRCRPPRRRVTMEASMEVSAHRGVFHPLASLGRSWRRLRRRPRAMQVRTALLIVAIVVGLVAWLVLAPSGTPGGSGNAGAAEVASSSHDADAGEPGEHERPRRRARPSINVVFPVVAVNSLAGKLGFAEDKEYNEQIPAIHLYVNQINDSGGINGRKINPIIVQFDPTNDANHAGAVPAVDPGQPRRLRGGRRHRHLDRGQPALRRPAGPDPAAQRLVDHDQLDQPGLALSVVDRPGHGARPRRRGAVGARARAAWATARRSASSCPTRRPTRRRSTTSCCRT